MPFHIGDEPCTLGMACYCDKENHQYNKLIADYVPFAISYLQIYNQDILRCISNMLTIYHNAKYFRMVQPCSRHWIMNNSGFPVKEIMAATSKKCI